MDKTTAQLILEEMTTFSNQLHNAVQVLSKECGQNAAAAYDLSVTGIVGEMVSRVLVPVWSAYPEMAPQGPAADEGWDHRTFRVSIEAARSALNNLEKASETLNETELLVTRKVPPGQERQALVVAFEKLRARLVETRELLEAEIKHAPS